MPAGCRRDWKASSTGNSESQKYLSRYLLRGFDSSDEDSPATYVVPSRRHRQPCMHAELRLFLCVPDPMLHTLSPETPVHNTKSINLLCYLDETRV